MPLLPGRRIFQMRRPLRSSTASTAGRRQARRLLRLNAGWRRQERPAQAAHRRLGRRRPPRPAGQQRATSTGSATSAPTTNGFVWFRDEGPLDTRVLAGHDTSPTTVDWDKDGIPDLLVGAEDGRMYYKRNPRADSDRISHGVYPRGPVLGTILPTQVIRDVLPPG